MKRLSLLPAKSLSCLLCLAMPCQPQRNQYWVIAWFYAASLMFLFFSLSGLKNVDIKLCFSVSLTDCCEFLWAGLAYWCSYNLDTLQELMSILTRLSLWPHFLLLGGGNGDGAVRIAYASWEWAAYVCVVCVWKEKEARKGVSVRPKLTCRPFPAVG